MHYDVLVARAREEGLDVVEQPGLPEQGCYAAEPGRRAVLLIRSELGEPEKLLVVVQGLRMHSVPPGEAGIVVKVIEVTGAD